MKFSLASLVVLAAGLSLVAAEPLCCIYGPPSACAITGSAKRAPEPVAFGPGPECCCPPASDGTCGHCTAL
ncbi:hypothetical protein NM688_g331 [Phlebia brevispora]|uniref:Uncharacterized protein n=1 Tax=Phlebia brevispora TaxID=194682 RepID=A0ACC1TED3_9APHY|nr:hypothetical protein NM688_g331 [Phlebia brevispora]